MTEMKVKFKRIIVAIITLAVFLSVTGYANTTDINPEKEFENGQTYVVQDLLNYLGLGVRYDDVTRESLYKEGLLKVLDAHPELYEEILRATLESIDEHSEYYDAEEAKVLNEEITGTIVGIGITFQMCPDGVDVRGVIPDTPAAKAGLQVGDVIVSVDDILLEGLNSDTAGSYIRGDEGTSLRAGVKRKNIADILYLDMVREKIIGTSVTSQVYEDGADKLMYIAVYGFVSNTAEMFKAALDSAKEQKINNLIIDVRDNGGGLFDQAILMADYLVPKGSIITTEDHKLKFLNYVYMAEQEDDGTFDTVVLVNENSASASEVLAAALSENGCAKLVGTKTYGKGTIQTVMPLPYGDCVKYTIGYYLTPKDNNINKVGLTPDALVENKEMPLDMSKYTEFGYTQVYKIGDKGPDIKTAKELLNLWGAFEGEISEEYDEELKNAVFLFQSATQLFPYGVLDLTTQRELYTRLEKSKVVTDDQLDAAFSYFGMTRKVEE